MKDSSRFATIRYGSVWEDADTLCRALAPVAGGGRLLSVASAGDNALALLTLDPEEVVAVDYNPAQIACLELRVAAFRVLDYVNVLEFLGVTSGGDRLESYRRLRSDLSAATRRFWDAHPRAIQHGILQAGRLERYMRGFRRWVLPLVHRRATVGALMEARPREERERFYNRIWDTLRWRCLFRIFFSRAVMSRFGRDPSCFTHVRGSFGEQLLQGARRALVSQPGNPYVTHFLTGTFSPASLPRYLRPEHFPVIRARLDRLQPVCASLSTYLPGCAHHFDGFNLSNVFEYLAPEAHEALYRDVLKRARSGARLVYWNLQVPRAIPRSCAARAQPLREIAAELREGDCIPLYQALHVDEVGGGTVG